MPVYRTTWAASPEHWRSIVDCGQEEHAMKRQKQSRQPMKMSGDSVTQRVASEDRRLSTEWHWQIYRRRPSQSVSSQNVPRALQVLTSLFLTPHKLHSISELLSKLFCCFFLLSGITGLRLCWLGGLELDNTRIRALGIHTHIRGECFSWAVFTGLLCLEAVLRWGR